VQIKEDDVSTIADSDTTSPNLHDMFLPSWKFSPCIVTVDMIGAGQLVGIILNMEATFFSNKNSTTLESGMPLLDMKRLTAVAIENLGEKQEIREKLIAVALTSMFPKTQEQFGHNMLPLTLRVINSLRSMGPVLGYTWWSKTSDKMRTLNLGRCIESPSNIIWKEKLPNAFLGNGHVKNEVERTSARPDMLPPNIHEKLNSRLKAVPLTERLVGSKLRTDMIGHTFDMVGKSKYVKKSSCLV
jgi:hypothetical protein